MPERQLQQRGAARARSLEVRLRNAERRAEEAWQVIETMRRARIGWQQIAKALNRYSIPAPRGGQWCVSTVQ